MFSIIMNMEIKLDNKDKKILQTIDTKARLSIANISRKTGIQRDSVLYRINKMKKSGVIRFFSTTLNPEKMGYPISSFVNFELYNLTKQEEKKFIAFLKSHPYVVYVAKTTGRWDTTTQIVAKNLEQFDSTISEIRMKFPKIIKDYNTASIIKEIKYDNMVDLI